MKIFSKIFVILILASVSIPAQRKFVDILLFADSIDIPRYPYQEKYDSLQNTYNINIQKLREDDPNAIIDNFEPESSLYAVVDGKKYTIKEYLQYIEPKIPKDFWIMIKLKVEWNGTISEAKIIATKNDKWDKEILIDIIRKLKADPAINEAGFPNPDPHYMNWVISGKN